MGELGQAVLQGRDVARADGVDVLGVIGQGVDEISEDDAGSSGPAHSVRGCGVHGFLKLVIVLQQARALAGIEPAGVDQLRYLALEGRDPPCEINAALLDLIDHVGDVGIGPGAYDLPDPAPIDLSEIDQNWPTFTYVLGLPPRVREMVRKARVTVVQGRKDADLLDGHLLQCREKVAIALALLHGEREVTEDFWDLSETVMEMSLITRSNVQSELS